MASGVLLSHSASASVCGGPLGLCRRVLRVSRPRWQNAVFRCALQDTFLDVQHVRDSFPGYEIEFVNNSGGPEPVRPFRVTFPSPELPSAQVRCLWAAVCRGERLAGRARHNGGSVGMCMGTVAVGSSNG
jgi:hypothetical protein